MTRMQAVPSGRFRHEAMLYAGEAGFMRGSLDFIREGLARDEAVLVVVKAEKIAALRGALGRDGDAVDFADMGHVGANPARIIPAWRDFVEESTAVGRGFRGIGEPIDTDRTPAELAECHVHEALLNLAFADSAPWQLLCPYDVSTLPDPVVQEALRNHPIVVRHGVAAGSGEWRHDMARVLAEPLPEPDEILAELDFDASTLLQTRELVRRYAERQSCDARVDDFVLATYEAATNSVRHAGGQGSLRIWCAEDALVCEVSDTGRITDPLVGRSRPSPDQDSGRGVWLANQLCDLVQLRVLPSGNVLRLHLRHTPA
jgi:anti-sigma regulatory factor (Ser/Thr protein kinase)